MQGFPGTDYHFSELFHIFSVLSQLQKVLLLNKSQEKLFSLPQKIGSYNQVTLSKNLIGIENT